MIDTIVKCKKVKDFPLQGQNSKAYLAVEENLGREIAVKDIDVSQDFDPAKFEQYFHEARIACRADHPRIIKILYAGYDDKDCIARIATEYYKNGSVQELLNTSVAAGQYIPLRDIVKGALNVIQGIEHLHGLDLLHLDVKPSNALVGNDSRWILTDFGQSKFLNGATFATDLTCYDKNLSPEVIQNGVAERRTDIYQFGLFLYRLCCENLFVQQTLAFQRKPDFCAAVIRGQFPDRSAYNLYVPKQLKTIINKCIDPDVKARFPSAKAVHEALSSLVVPDIGFDANTCSIFGTIKNKKVNIVCTLAGPGEYAIRTEVNGRHFLRGSKDNVKEPMLGGEAWNIIKILSN